jgi:hypothetical protein
MKTSMVAGIAAVVAFTAMTEGVHAEPTKKDDSYGYVFDDDALRAEGKSANTAQITVRRPASRERLVRPRVHFVTEMLKSVEHM